MWVCWQFLRNCAPDPAAGCTLTLLRAASLRLSHTFTSAGLHCLDVGARNAVSALRTTFNLKVTRNGEHRPRQDHRRRNGPSEIFESLPRRNLAENSEQKNNKRFIWSFHWNVLASQTDSAQPDRSHMAAVAEGSFRSDPFIPVIQRFQLFHQNELQSVPSFGPIRNSWSRHGSWFRVFHY